MSTENQTCSRCRHWGTFGLEGTLTDDHDDGMTTPPPFQEEQFLKACGRVAHVERATEVAKDDGGECIRRDHRYVYRLSERHRDTLAFVQDGSDYFAVLLTRAEFYCAHFERRDT